MAELRLSLKQEQSIAQSTARINLWDGSVRSGKTIGSLIRWLTYVATAPRDGDLLVMGKTFDTVARNIFGPLQNPAITGPAARLIKYTRGAGTATILGRQVEVITFNDKSAENRVRGLTAAGAYVDEVTLMPENVWDQLLARLSVPGAKLFGTTNPDNPGHWLMKKFIKRRGELDLNYWHFKIDDNHALDPVYVANLKREFVGLWYRRFILGQWVQAEGAIYDMWDPDRHVVDILPPINRWVALGVDYGTVNPFAALLLGIGTAAAPKDPIVRPRLYLAGEYRYDSRVRRRQLTDVQYSRQMRDWLARYPVPHSPGLVGVRPEWTCVDPSAASFVQQLYDDGLMPTLADNSVLDGIRLVSSLLGNDDLIVHSSCTGWTDEVGGYAWDDKAAAEGEDKPIKADDHSLDGGRYGIKTTEFAWRSQLHYDLAA
jgi:PBSX family phage terminase large subunit